MSGVIQQALELEVPVRTAYDQFTQFLDYPRFVRALETAEQLDDRHVRGMVLLGDRELGLGLGEDLTGGAHLGRGVLKLGGHLGLLALDLVEVALGDPESGTARGPCQEQGREQPADSPHKARM